MMAAGLNVRAVASGTGSNDSAVDQAVGKAFQSGRDFVAFASTAQGEIQRRIDQSELAVNRLRSVGGPQSHIDREQSHAEFLRTLQEVLAFHAQRMNEILADSAESDREDTQKRVRVLASGSSAVGTQFVPSANQVAAMYTAVQHR